MPRGYPDTRTCPNCEEGWPAEFFFCPDCGADMDKKLAKPKRQTKDHKATIKGICGGKSKMLIESGNEHITVEVHAPFDDFNDIIKCECRREDFVRGVRKVLNL